MVVFKDKIWLMGGLEGGKVKAGSPNYEEMSHKSDIWVSENGKDWQSVKEKAPWGKRRSAGLVVFQDKIWLMEGWEADFGETKNDIWVSEDGINWKLVTSNPPWPARHGHVALEYKDNLWIKRKKES